MSSCRYCGLNGHKAMYCYARPRQSLLAKRAIRKLGKHGQKWLKVRAEWFSDNPAHMYTCYICGEQLTAKETTLDHIKSRSRYPELRYEISNLAPCCWRCNKLKGNKDLEEV